MPTVAVPMGFGFDRDNHSADVFWLTVSYVDEASDSVGNHLGVTYTQTHKHTNTQNKMRGVGLIKLITRADAQG